MSSLRAPDSMVNFPASFFAPPSLVRLCLHYILRDSGLESTEVAPNHRDLSTRIQSLLFVIVFRFGSILCSHYSRRCHENRKPIQYATNHFQDQSSAAWLRHKNRSKIDLLCLNESTIRHVFGAGTRAIIRYRCRHSLRSREIQSNFPLRPPLLSDHFSKIPKFPQSNPTIDAGTARKRPPLVGDHDHF